jgi:Cu+-exporting ATPase
LALAAPFALGTAQRLLAKRQIFLKNVLVLERLAEVDSIVFDKTGTLASSRFNKVSFHNSTTGKISSDLAEGVPARSDDRSQSGAGTAQEGLTPEEARWAAALAIHSSHPCSRRLAEVLPGYRVEPFALSAATTISETPGAGLQGVIEGHEIRLGSKAWLESCHIGVPALELPLGTCSYLAVDGQIRGAFVFSNALRPQTENLFKELGSRYQLALLSGDNEKERATFAPLLGGQANLHFHQSPTDKLNFIRRLRESGRTVTMVGDGLNDAGALKQSDVGIAVVEKIGIFSPASDVILEAGQVPHLAKLLDFSRSSTRVVRASFGVSAIYNLIGVSIASAGILSPLICAVLMPLSSISVVLFACGLTRWAAKRAGLDSFTPLSVRVLS